MQEQTAGLSELSVERDNLLNKIDRLEREHNEAMGNWHEQIRIKEESMSAEMSQLEISFKESEHMLREDVEEKAHIIQVRCNYIVLRVFVRYSSEVACIKGVYTCYILEVVFFF